jgi:glycosyltransferase involved in cell wall biosynthesis
LCNATYFITSSSEIERLSLPARHIIQTIKVSVEALKGYPPAEKVFIYSASNFWPDVVPAVFLKKKMPNSRWVGSCYLPIPNPFGGFEYAYEQKRRIIPDFKTLGNYLVEKPSSLLLKQYADFIFVTNDADKKYFTDAGVPPNKLKAIYGGVDLEAISKVPNQEKVYDGCFVGRIHPQKGLIYLIKIWDYVCKQKPKARLAIIGDGSIDYEKKVKGEIRKRHLEENIDFLGFADGVKKYKILKSSRVFLHTSIYDNSGMAAAEGMACGLPAVRFDIPALKIAYPKGMLVSRLKDCESFADNVLILLRDNGLYRKTQEDALSLMQDWDWNKKAQDALNFLNEK